MVAPMMTARSRLPQVIGRIGGTAALAWSVDRAFLPIGMSRAAIAATYAHSGRSPLMSNSANSSIFSTASSDRASACCIPSTPSTRSSLRLALGPPAVSLIGTSPAASPSAAHPPVVAPQASARRAPCGCSGAWPGWPDPQSRAGRWRSAALARVRGTHLSRRRSPAPPASRRRSAPQIRVPCALRLRQALLACLQASRQRACRDGCCASAQSAQLRWKPPSIHHNVLASGGR